MMKNLAVAAVTALALSSPALAQESPRFEVSLGYSTTRIDSTSFVDENATLEVDDLDGFTVGAEYFFSPAVGVHVAYGQLEQDAWLEFHDTAPSRFLAGELGYDPIAASVRWHVPVGDRIEAFVGAGLLFASFDELRSDELADLEINSLEIDEEVELLVELGARFAFSKNVGISIDASFSPVEAESTATFVDGTTGTTDLELNPVTVTGSFSLRF